MPSVLRSHFSGVPPPGLYRAFWVTSELGAQSVSARCSRREFSGGGKLGTVLSFVCRINSDRSLETCVLDVL